MDNERLLKALLLLQRIIIILLLNLCVVCFSFLFFFSEEKGDNETKMRRDKRDFQISIRFSPWFKKGEIFFSSFSLSNSTLSRQSGLSNRFLRTLFQSLLRVSLFCLCSHAHRWYAQELLDVNSTQSKRERERVLY